MNVMFICLALLLWTVRVHKQGYHSIQQLQKTCSQVTCKNNFHSSLTTGLPGETEQRGPPRSLRARPLASLAECFPRSRRGLFAGDFHSIELLQTPSPFGMYSSTYISIFFSLFL